MGRSWLEVLVSTEAGGTCPQVLAASQKLAQLLCAGESGLQVPEQARRWRGWLEGGTGMAGGGEAELAVRWEGGVPVAAAYSRAPPFHEPNTSPSLHTYSSNAVGVDLRRPIDNQAACRGVSKACSICPLLRGFLSAPPVGSASTAVCVREGAGLLWRVLG